MWPFDRSDLLDQPVAGHETAHDKTAQDKTAHDRANLVATIAPLREQILAAATEPYGLTHSDLHRQHLLHIDGELTGILDFGDAFIGSTAWDLALVRWYYGATNTRQLVDAYAPSTDLFDRAELLALAIGCYKAAKTPSDASVPDRLRELITALHHRKPGL